MAYLIYLIILYEKIKRKIKKFRKKNLVKFLKKNLKLILLK
jgi:hypothetical protein